MKVFYAPHGLRPKNLWPMLALPAFVAVVLIMLFDRDLLDEYDRPYTPIHRIFLIIVAGLFSLFFIAYFFSLFKRRVVLRIESGQISCFENVPRLQRKLPFSSFVGFTHFYEHSMAQEVTGKRIDFPYRYIILHFRQPDCAWMIPEKSFQDIQELKDFLRSVGIPEIPFARSMYPNDALYVPVNFLYVPNEADCGMIVDRRQHHQF
ncbi:MAG: hypothetical protein QM270_08390 [Bacillota bacterium]|nr:hypothetical protein [Bacillota bacterium]